MTREQPSWLDPATPDPFSRYKDFDSLILGDAAGLHIPQRSLQAFTQMARRQQLGGRLLRVSR